MTVQSDNVGFPVCCFRFGVLPGWRVHRWFLVCVSRADAATCWLRSAVSSATLRGAFHMACRFVAGLGLVKLVVSQFRWSFVEGRFVWDSRLAAALRHQRAARLSAWPLLIC